jgi:hypothetical protein
MAPTREEWAEAYWRQSKSDWDAFTKLFAETSILNCTALHFLQMAGEKIAKAYRFRDTKADVDTLLTSHVALSKFMAGFLFSPEVSSEFVGRKAQFRRVVSSVKSLAREVEKLAPAVDRRNSPENAEYPWESGGKVVCPASYSFPNLSKLMGPTGQRFIALLRRAIDEFGAIRVT